MRADVAVITHDLLFRRRFVISLQLITPLSFQTCLLRHWHYYLRH